MNTEKNVMDKSIDSGKQIACNDICFIAAKLKDDFEYDSIKSYGFNIKIPYKDKNLLLRLMREAWFRLHLPCRKIWFNKGIKDIKQKIIIVKDSLICIELMKYIREKHPDAKIILLYVNRVYASFAADEARKYADELWSYDGDDCKQYGMRRTRDYYYERYRIREEDKKQPPEHDIVYIGRDKGRADYLLSLQKQFEDMGLKTLFHITADRSYQRFKKKLYKPLIPYREYVDMLRDTRALVNIMPEGQTSITLRDMEVIFDSVKGITNNLGILQTKYYHPDRYFILGRDNLEDLPVFLSRPFPKVSEEELEPLKFNNMIMSML